MTPSRIDSNAFGAMAASTGANPQASTTSGSLKGDPCLVKDPARMLVDAAEELGRELSDKVGDKAHGARQVKAARRPMPVSIEKCQQYLEKAKSLDDQARLQKFADQLLRTGGLRAHEQAGRQAPGNSAEQFTLLTFARKQGEDGKWPAETRAWIDAALENLWDTAGPEIEARLATIDAAAAYGDTAREVQTFQANYDLLASKRYNFSDTLKLVMSQLGGKDGSKMESAFNALIAATGQQMPTCSQPQQADHLMEVASTLFELKAMNTVKAGCGELLARTLESEAGRA